MGLARLFILLNGRIGRRDWWQGVMLLVLVVSVFVPGLGFFVAIPTGITSMSFEIWMLFLAPPLSYLVLCLHVKRLHDLGRSGWWTLAPISLQVAGWIAGRFGFTAAAQALSAMFLASTIALQLLIAFARGQRGDNRFGPPVVNLLQNPAS